MLSDSVKKTRLALSPSESGSRWLLLLYRSFMGGNIHKDIQRVVYVDPKAYNRLNESQKYDVADLLES